MPRTITTKRIDLKPKGDVLRGIAAKMPPHAAVEGWMELVIHGVMGERGYRVDLRYHAIVYTGGVIVSENAINSGVLGDRLRAKLNERTKVVQH